MPLYDAECETCGKIEERWGKYESLSAGFICACGGHEHYLPSFGRSADAQRFTPVVVHRDAQGNIRFPGSADAPVPEGFQKVELTNITEIRNFEREVNQRDSVEAQTFNDAQRRFREGQLAENRRELQKIIDGGSWKGMNRETGEEITLHGLTERGRRFYDAMRKVGDHKSQNEHKSVNPAFFIEAFSLDASNRDHGYDYKNKMDGWEKRNK